MRDLPCLHALRAIALALSYCIVVKDASLQRFDSWQNNKEKEKIDRIRKVFQIGRPVTVFDSKGGIIITAYLQSCVLSSGDKILSVVHQKAVNLSIPDEI